ncbi:DUF397 domain-containing protein [Streptomyces sp. URMC 129]|uniref:DUF397 domain-containing protein n=1 Tax=Streptomyces sp. URMC 129 TaxID=3423407 RepID=UPI003F1D4F8F
MRAEELRWVKSSYSDASGGACVEVAWGKSSHSDASGGDCVEVGRCCGSVHVRDSKNKNGGQLTLSREQWAAFTAFATVGSWT